MTFIGPPAAVIDRMGSKVEARNLMIAAGVPVVPGLTPHDQSDDGVIAAAAARACVRFAVTLPLVKLSARRGAKRWPPLVTACSMWSG